MFNFRLWVLGRGVRFEYVGVCGFCGPVCWPSAGFGTSCQAQPSMGLEK